MPNVNKKLLSNECELFLLLLVLFQVSKSLITLFKNQLG